MKELLRIRDARIALAARTFSQVGDAMTLIGLSILVAQTGRPIELTVLLVAFALPVVMLASYAGRLVDTHDSRALLTIAALVQVAGSAALLVSTSLPWQVGCVLVIQSAQAVAGPGWGALLPRIVGEERIAHAIGLQQALGSAAWLAGTALGGLAYAAVGFRGVVLVDTLTFAALVIAAQVVRTHRGPNPSATLVQGAGEAGASGGIAPVLDSGWGVLRRDRVSGLVVVGLVLFVMALEGTNAVESFLVIDVLGGGPATYGLVGLSLGVGVTIGSMLCAKVDGDRRRVSVLTAAATVMGATIAGSGLVGSVGWMFPLFFLAGVANGLLSGLGFAVIVGRAADAARGRVLATAMGAIRGGSVLSLLAAGVAGGLFGPQAVFVGGGILAITVAPVILLAREGRPASTDARAEAAPSLSRAT